MYSNIDDKGIAKNTRPATQAELAALDATRGVPYLKAICNRIRIHIPNPNPPPAEIIPYIENRLAEHNNRRRHILSDCSGEYFEWKATKDDLEEFITYLKSLNAPLPSVNPTSDQPQRPVPEPKPNQTETPLQTNDLARTVSEPEADQKRIVSEPKVENPAQPAANQPGLSQQNPKPPEPTEPAAETEEQCRERLKKETCNMSLQQFQEFAAKTFLPEPNESNIKEYGSKYFDIYGPPKRARIDKQSPELQQYLLVLLEDLSLEKVQRQLMLPPPFGQYIIVSKSALRRFKIRHHTREAKRTRRSLRQRLQAVLAQPDLTDADFDRATNQLLKVRLIECGLKPDPDLTETKTLIDMLEKIRAGKLAERKLALAESKQ